MLSSLALAGCEVQRKARVDTGIDDPGAHDSAVLVVDIDGDGYAATVDCDDSDATINPGVAERCDGADDDCDRSVDEADAVDAPRWFPDTDADGYGDRYAGVRACSNPGAYVSNGDDCNDANPTISPGMVERCNLRDDNCDGVIDEDAAADASRWYPDVDADGYGVASGEVIACSAPAGYSPVSTDCDDGDAAFHPNAAESDCHDPADYNCDGSTGYSDADADGFPACDECDDTDATIFPGAAETCNHADDDCDGQIDDHADGAILWFVDADGDGFGAGTGTESCDAPAGSVADGTDCVDSTYAAHPGGTEVCDDLDDDCDGETDEEATDAPTWYADLDSDSFGDPDNHLSACDAPAAYLADSSDCDDTSAAICPGAAEDPANTLDDDCDGMTDEGTFTLGADIQPIWDDSCAYGGCHTGSRPSAGLDLSSGAADTNDVPSTQVPTMDRIEPGDTALSYLWHKLQGTQATVGGGGNDMPDGGALPPDKLDMIEAWIVDGAP